MNYYFKKNFLYIELFKIILLKNKLSISISRTEYCKIIIVFTQFISARSQNEADNVHIRTITDNRISLQ